MDANIFEDLWVEDELDMNIFMQEKVKHLVSQGGKLHETAQVILH